MKLIINGLLFLIISTASATTFARQDTANVSCYQCSLAEKRLAALEAAEKLFPSIRSTINVLDFSNSSVSTFLYEVGTGGVINPDNYYTLREISPSRSIRESMNAATDQIKQLSLKWPKDRDGIDSAFDFVKHAQGSSVIDNWYHDKHPLDYWFNNLVSFFGGVYFDILRGYPIKVEFSDGSLIYIKTFDWDSSTSLRIEYVQDSARDADGNRVPANRSQFVGTFYQTEGSIDKWVGNAHSFGVPVTRKYTRTGRASRGLTTTCIHVSAGKISCTIVSRNEDSVNPE